MNKYLAPSICAIFVLVNSGCTIKQTTELTSQGCSTVWFENVSEQISTGDAKGHGPDIGSMEWRSVVEFKLGIRDDPNVPPLDSEQWCRYINEHFIDNGA